MSYTHAWKGVRPFKRHSLVLLVAGFVFVAIGGSYLFAEPTESRLIALSVAISWMSLEKWGVVFVLCGALSIVSSRWPPISETWGYAVLTGLSAGWAAFYAMGVIFDESPAANLNGTLSWGLIAFMWWAISGLDNPDPRRPEVVYERDDDS